jgi:CRP/FNR family cyclic AMP-dependent transcriptional regulator
MTMRHRHHAPAKLALLRRLPALHGCTDDQLRKVAALVDEISVDEGHQLIAEGATTNEVFVIVEGWAAVMTGDEPVAALGPGELVGELAILDGGPRSATVIAKTPMQLLVISAKAFDDFVEIPPVGRALSKTLAGRVRRAESAQTRQDG